MALARLVSASQASTYYYESDPITSPNDESENSLWQGSLAQELSLTGAVKAEDFKALLAGHDTKSDKILVQAGVNKEHRAGIDLVFSAPKSVSIVALHLGDEAVIDAHNQAVIKALDYVEKNLIQYREFDPIAKDVFKVKSDNMVVGTFVHSTSRSNDPQLHTHSVILNITKINKKQFKAISNELIFNNQKLINNIYQNELALNIQNLGYKIDNYDNKFEIAGVDEEAIKTFSKRSVEIQDTLTTLKETHKDLSEEELKDRATLKSRDNKTHDLTKDDLKDKWEKEFSKELINPIKEDTKGAEKADINDDTRVDYETYSEGINSIIRDAIKELTVSEATFSRAQLLNTIINQNKGKDSLDTFNMIVDTAIRNESVILLGHKEDVRCYSTFEMISIENSIIEYAKDSKNTLESLLSEEKVSEFIYNDIFAQKEFIIGDEQSELPNDDIEISKPLIASEKLPELSNDDIDILDPLIASEKPSELEEGKTLTVGQIKFIRHVLTSKDKLNVIQGDAGVGKTYAVNKLREILEDEAPETKIVGLGFTGKAAEELSSAANIDTSTIASFLLSEKVITNSIILVDEASMVSSRDMLSLMEKAGDNRIVLVGDGKQLQAIGAGKMFKELQSAGVVSTIEMEEVLRQQTDITKEVVKQIKLFQTEKDKKILEDLFKLLDESENIIEIKSNDRNIENAVNEYMKDDDTLLLTQSRKDKNILNDLIRVKYLPKEDLENSKMLKIKESITGNAFLSTTYKLGDKILIDKDDGEIISLDHKSNKFTIKVGDTEREINPLHDSVIAYRECEKEFTKGDKVLFTRNDKMLKVQNGLSGVIEDIIEDKVYIKTKNDREIIINIDNYAHIDHAYAQTLHKSQGATCKKAILLHSKSDYLSTEALYVAATRATEEFKILTSDKKKLMDTSKRAQAKSSTRDFSGVIDTVIRQQTEKEAQAEAKATLEATLDTALQK